MKDEMTLYKNLFHCTNQDNSLKTEVARNKIAQKLVKDREDHVIWELTYSHCVMALTEIAEV